ncbi:MAG: double zinc ribbon domain-containing protein, partial [Candidatus Binatia bacterium]
MSECPEKTPSSTTVAFGTPINRGLAFLLNCLYPPRCRFCKRCLSSQDETFCAGCHGKIRLVSHPLCKTCGRPFLDIGGE